MASIVAKLAKLAKIAAKLTGLPGYLTGRTAWLGAVALLGIMPASIGCVGLPYPLPLLPELVGKLAPEATDRTEAQPLKERGGSNLGKEAKQRKGGAERGAAGESDDLSVDRIAYISPYGDLFTIKPDGSGERRLTGASQVRPSPTQPDDPEAAYTRLVSHLAGGDPTQSLNFDNVYAWPTWSPDGRRLAVSRLRLGENRSLRLSVLVVDAKTGRSRTVYENDVPALIADGTPHYLYWSPNGEYLSFLALTRQGLTLFIVNPGDPRGAVALERGAPIYYSFGGGGEWLMIHTRGQVKLLRRPFSPSETLLLPNAGGFRTPALSPDGRRWAYAAASASGNFIYVGETDDPAAGRPVLEVGFFSAFLWSPDSNSLAVADTGEAPGQIFQNLTVVNLDAEGNVSEALPVVSEPMLAFYWSPDGETLAWVYCDPEEEDEGVGVMAVSLKEAPEEAPGRSFKGLGHFAPSREMSSMLDFADQYAYSHSLWSPDSSHLVVSAEPDLINTQTNGHTPAGNQIHLLAVTEGEEPVEIDPDLEMTEELRYYLPPEGMVSGSAAFWSWN